MPDVKVCIYYHLSKIINYGINSVIPGKKVRWSSELPKSNQDIQVVLRVERDLAVGAVIGIGNPVFWELASAPLKVMNLHEIFAVNGMYATRQLLVTQGTVSRHYEA